MLPLPRVRSASTVLSVNSVPSQHGAVHSAVQCEPTRCPRDQQCRPTWCSRDQQCASTQCARDQGVLSPWSPTCEPPDCRQHTTMERGAMDLHTPPPPPAHPVAGDTPSFADINGDPSLVPESMDTIDNTSRQTTATPLTAKRIRSPSPTDSEGEKSTKKPTPNEDDTKDGVKIPPIFMARIKNWAQLALSLHQVTKDNVYIKNLGDKYKISTKTVEHFRAVQRLLTQEKVYFYTHPLRTERILKVILKGVPFDEDLESVKKELISQNFPVAEATRLKTKKGLTSLILLTLKPTDGMHPIGEIYKLNRFMYLVVTVEKYRRRAGPPQCHNCQGFGHGSAYCHWGVKCVRCGANHHVSDCEKPAGETGTCANCGENHNSNYRGCQFFQNLLNPDTKYTPEQTPPNADLHQNQANTVRPEITTRRRTQPPAHPPAKTEKPTAKTTEVEDSDSEEDEDNENITYASAARQHRKRKPRNVENRGPKQPRMNESRHQEQGHSNASTHPDTHGAPAHNKAPAAHSQTPAPNHVPGQPPRPTPRHGRPHPHSHQDNTDLQYAPTNLQQPTTTRPPPGNKPAVITNIVIQLMEHLIKLTELLGLFKTMVDTEYVKTS